MYDNIEGGRRKALPPPRKKKKSSLYTDAVLSVCRSLRPPSFIREFLTAYSPPVPSLEYIRNEVDVFDESVNHLMDLRHVKRWAKYKLSDGLIRYGTVHRHPLYNALPGWLVDVLWLRRQNPDLALLWCTDIRGVNEHLGSLCNLINLHGLFRRVEGGGNNFTGILIHMTVLSTMSLNPINRRGMKYPHSEVASRTFENIKRLLMGLKNNKTTTEKKKGRKRKKRPIHNILLHDDLSSFFTRIMTVLPPRVGTNYFDIIL